MVDLTKEPEEVFRDFATEGVAASGKHNPPKADVRVLFREVVDAVDFLENNQLTGSLIYPSLADLEDNTSAPVNQRAEVNTNGSTPSEDGIYYHEGAGVWTKVSDLITVTNATAIAALEERVAVLEAESLPLVITSFSADISEFENGATEDIALSWTITAGAYDLATLTVQSGSATPVSKATTDTGHTFTGVTDTTTYTLTVTDVEGRTDTETVTVTNRPSVYFGTSTSTSLNSAAIVALSNSDLESNRAQSFTVDTSGGKYPYYAWPTRFGAISGLKVFGFTTDPVIATVSVTNASGATENYYTVRTVELQDNANTNVEVS